MDERWTTFDLMEGFYLSHAIVTLHEEGVLHALQQPQTVEQLVAQYPFDFGMLRSLLQYVAARTDLVEQRGEQFAIKANYESKARFLIDQYIGTYGSNIRQLALLLRDPSCAPSLVNRSRHAQAYANLDALGLPILADLILQLGLDHLLDLACGPGSLLLTLAKRNAAFTGWGVDLNPWMCSRARERVQADHLDQRIQIWEGDCIHHIETILSAELREQVETISAASLLNEFFGRDRSPIVSWLQTLRTVYPERTLLVADYYGRLGCSDPPWPRTTLLHDFAQIISGQGIPPPDGSTWSEIYEAAGCTLIHTMEDKSATFFIHIVRL